MMNSLKVILLILLCSLYGTAQSDKGVKSKIVDGKRWALVIGNANYKTAGRLNNTLNDSREMRATLTTLGFSVIGGDDLSGDEMKKVIKDFGQKLNQGGIGLFYYSGHGIQANGRNYLIPVDAPDTLREATLEFETVDVNRVLAEMSAAKNGFNIMILDACRNNPFSKGWRDASGGLAQIKAPTGTLIAYATAPDATASDGSRKNGTYTEKLLQRMTFPNTPVEQVFKSVSEDVFDETEGQQDPWYASSLKGNFYFNKQLGGETPPPKITSTLQLKTIENQLGMEFILIPSGWFFMGAPSAEIEYDWEKPLLREKVNKDFYLGKYEVTQNDWKQIMKSNPSEFKNCPLCPVENISWLEIQTFIKKLNGLGDGKYRLPTEVEWEFAVRANSRTKYYWGEDTDFVDVKNYAWYEGNSKFKTHEVGLKLPNAFGLHDMEGNVWEWCEDRWDSNSSRRVIRGGSWLSSYSHLRSAMRSDLPPETRHNYIGFRLVKEN